MGRRGPKPTPTKILKLRGTHRADRTRGEPLPQGKAPAPPEWLLPAAREEWERLLPELERMGLLTSADWAQFAQYCQVWARWIDAEEKLVANGSVMELYNEHGDLKYSQISPWVTIAHKALERLQKLGAEFGLTPSARSRLSIDKPKDADAAGSDPEVDKILGLNG
jgi:P27 family predicted phage terminase small subunit